MEKGWGKIISDNPEMHTQCALFWVFSQLVKGARSWGRQALSEALMGAQFPTAKP